MAYGNLVQALERGITILEMLSESKSGMKLNDIAVRLGVKAPTAHNLLRTLISKNLVMKSSKTVYSLGSGVTALANGLNGSDMTLIIEAMMQKFFTKRTESTVTYAENVGAEVKFKLRISPDRPNVIQHPESQVFHPYANASGLAALAFCPETNLEYIYERYPFFEFGAHLWKKPSDLDAFIRESRKNGYVVCPFERTKSLRVAVPITDSSGLLKGIAGFSIPVKYFDEDHQEADMISDFVKSVKEIEF